MQLEQNFLTWDEVRSHVGHKAEYKNNNGAWCEVLLYEQGPANISGNSEARSYYARVIPTDKTSWGKAWLLAHPTETASPVTVLVNDIDRLRPSQEAADIDRSIEIQIGDN